jgi:hypothetical protein
MYSFRTGWLGSGGLPLETFLPGVLAALTSTHRGRRRTAPPSTAIENLKESQHCLDGARRTARTPCRNRHARYGHRRINITQGPSVAMMTFSFMRGFGDHSVAPASPRSGSN